MTLVQGLVGMLVGVGAAVHAASPCLDRPIHFAHYEFGAAHSEGHGGIDDDVQKELERRSGCKFEVRLLPRARIWLELEKGGVDMAGSGIQTPARERFAWFSFYLFEDNQVVIGPQVPAQVHSMESFIQNTTLRLGGVRSYSYSPYYDVQVQRLSEKNRFDAANDPDMLFRMFEKGRFDIFIASTLLFLHYFKSSESPVPVRIEDWGPTGPTPSGLVLARGSFSPEQAQQWQSYVADMLRDGTMRRILVRHMGDEWGPRALYQPPPKPKSP